ncbi:MAG: alpha-1,2-fucosyltransferase [Deltaproteobacteria bacterium]|nr:MAG: alpha-1,2-fucosyltransferase [Deltaproteobacteria bacterium]
MIIVRLMGGLGNQMFQYAAGLRLAHRHQTELKLDLSFLMDRSPRENFAYRDFDLVVFSFPTSRGSPEEVRQFRCLRESGSRNFLRRIANKLTRRHYYFEHHLAFDPSVLELPDETYLEGYFQNESYFSDIEQIVRQRFRLAPDESKLPAATRRLANEIRTDDAVCLHVRRADYVTNPVVNGYHGVCSLDYYKRGLAKLRSLGVSGRVFVFSDDDNWCRENFRDACQFEIVGNEHAGPRASTHLWLMTLCRHFLIPNSSFSWWAAWLSDSPRKVVVRPSQWMQARESIDVDICPPRWIKISNESTEFKQNAF